MPLTSPEQVQKNTVTAFADKFIRDLRGEATDLTVLQQDQVAALANSAADPSLVATCSALGAQILAEMRSPDSTGLTALQKQHAASAAAYGRDWYSNPTILAPTVTTTAMSNVSATAAVTGGTVTDSGGSTVTARGICYSTSPNPTTSDTVVAGALGASPAYSVTLSGLNPSTTYYVRAFATNSIGTSYGAQVSFATSAAPTGDHSHFDSMASHPNHHFSTSLRTAGEVNSWVLGGLNANKIIDSTEDAMRIKAWRGARDVLQPGEAAEVTGFTPLAWTPGKIVSIQYEVKFGNTGSDGSKTFNWRCDLSSGATNRITWETNCYPGTRLDNDSEHGADLFPVVYPLRLPGFAGVQFRLYANATLNAPINGYAGTNHDAPRLLDANGYNYTVGGDAATYMIGQNWVMSPDLHYRTSKTTLGGTQPFVFKVGIWYRFTQSIKDIGNNDYELWTWVSSEEDDPVLLLADKDDPNKGYPAFDWNLSALRSFLYEFQESAQVAGNNQYYWGRNVIVFDGEHVPLGGRPNGGSGPYVVPTSTVKMARAHANFGAVTSFNVAFVRKNSCSNLVIDTEHSIVAIVTVENAANRTITISDNRTNTWQIVEQTASTEANRVIIARTLVTNGGPSTVTVSIDSASAGMCYATIYEACEVTTVDSDSAVVTGTNLSGPTVSTSKQGLLFAGLVGDSDLPVGYIASRAPVLAVASQTQFTIAAGLTASNIGPDEAVASVLYSQEQYQIIRVLSYNTTTGVVVLENASPNPDNTLTTSAQAALIWKPRQVPEVDIDVSPKNWDLFFPVSAIAEGWTSPAPNHIHGVRAVFQPGNWTFPIKSSVSEKASIAIISAE